MIFFLGKVNSNFWNEVIATSSTVVVISAVAALWLVDKNVTLPPEYSCHDLCSAYTMAGR